MATYQANHYQFRRLMKSDEVGLYVQHEAERLADHLRSTSPIQTGEYVSQFHVESGGLDIRERDRAASFVVNDTPYAAILEAGSKTMKNPPAPMTNALDLFRT